MAIVDENTAGAAAGGEVMPKQFGKYTLLRRLAAGGMAELFLALHRSVAGFEKLIVIKRILPSMNQDQGFIEMLLHEARIAATLSHPNVVQIFDVGQVDGTYFIAMEHIHGEDIQSIVRGMKRMNVPAFPLEHTISILLGTCAGLAYAHDKRDLVGAALGIVHRDISPRNIVVSFTGDVKIVDFGIAKSGTEPGGDDTPSGQLKGKAPYMSPEQASGQPIDWRSDIFAAGVMLFELTTGRRLFKGASEYETLKMICDKEYPLPSQVKPDYPPALERIVMRALAKKREDRYQSAREMQADLESFAREERIAVSQVSLTKWMESLFADKLAQQKEALQDVKQLADVIAAQQTSLYEGSAVTSTGTLNASGASLIPAMPPKKSPLGVIAAVLGLVALGGGFVFMRRQAAMERREMTVAHDREMHDRASAPVNAPVVEARGALDITTTPDGCAIWLNGDLRSETTPAKIEKLPFGRALALKLTKEGFEPYRETVTLGDALPTKTINAEMKGGSVTVLLKIDPPATVWLDSKPWKGDRGKIDGISAGEEHKIVISASGYTPKTLTFTAQPGETKTFTETLLKADPSAPVPPGGKPDDGKPAAAPAKVRVGAKGGFCNVTVNGASFGATPVEATVQAGTVRVSCKPANGPAMSQSIQVAPGETGKVSFKVDP
ncbi:MAG: serine/threonine protein kinase [Byssovorax sp.]